MTHAGCTINGNILSFSQAKGECVTEQHHIEVLQCFSGVLAYKSCSADVRKQIFCK